MASSVSVGIVGEGPIGGQRDVVRPFDRQRHSGGGTKRGSGIRDDGAERHFFSFTLLLPTAPSARDTGRCTDRWRGGVCARVFVCAGWWRHSALYKCKRWRGRDIRGGTEEGGEKHCRGVCDFIMQSLIHVLFSFLLFFLDSMSDLLVYFITAAIKVHLRCHFALTRHIGYAA